MCNRHGIAYLGVLAVFGLIATTMVGAAVPQVKVHRIGLLSAVTPSSTWRAQAHYQAALEGLRQLGYVEGQNLVLEFRSADGELGRLSALAAELVGLKMDVIHVGTCGAPLDAARRATSKIPIVVAACTGDMVAAGAAASLARPGGNVTGLQKLNPELAAKRLALLKEAVPAAPLVAVLWDPGYSDFAADWLAMRATAQAFGVRLLSVEARGPAEFERAFSTMIDERADALITFADATTYIHARRIADLTARNRLPAIYAYREITDVGGLMSYGPSIPDLFRRSANFIDKILKGAKAGDLPIEQPTQFELVINLKTAKELGLTIPQTLRARADTLIE